MTDSLLIHVNCIELSEQTDVSVETIIECVEHGIVEPHGDSPDDWVFETNVIVVVQRAIRMHRELGIDWSGIALALDLLEQRDKLRQENLHLRNQLNRFLSE